MVIFRHVRFRTQAICHTTSRRDAGMAEVQTPWGRSKRHGWQERLIMKGIPQHCAPDESPRANTWQCAAHAYCGKILRTHESWGRLHARIL